MYLGNLIQAHYRQSFAKHLYRAILLPAVAFLLLIPTELTAQQYYTTEGTDFWLAIAPNWYDNDADQYHFAASSRHDCTVTISNPISGWSHTMSVSANSTTTYFLPTSLSNQVWQAGSCTITNKGLHITATDTIQFYTFNHSGTPNSSDAGTILPTSSLGTDYVILTYPTTTTNSSIYSTSYFSVLATEDNTIIDITLNGDTRYNSHSSGSTISITLNAGQIYQVMGTDANSNLTGTHVSVQNCKPIAVFCGSTHTDVPQYANGADLLFQQALPVSLWANEWILAPSHETQHDYALVISASDGCQLFINNNLATTINAYDSYEIDFTSPVHVVTSEPAMIFQYLPSRHNNRGDPASFSPNTIHMTTRCAIFPTFPIESRYPSTSNYYATVILPTAQTSLLRYNGAPVTQSFYPIPNTSYSHTTISLTFGIPNVLTTSGSGFFGHTYGLGENWDSYAFSLGGTDSMVFNHISFHNDTIDTTVCGNLFSIYGNTYDHSGEYSISLDCASTLLRLTLLPNFESYTDTVLCDSLCEWHRQSFFHTGHHSVSVPAPNGCDSIFHLNLTLHPVSNDTIPISCCSDSYIWNDSIINEDGLYSHTYSSIFGCDSTVTISLSLFPSYEFFIDSTVCTNSVFWNGQSYPVPCSRTISYSSIHGCDSIYHLNVSLSEPFDTTYFIQISDTQSYTWINGVTYSRDIDTAIYLPHTSGCDSIYRLRLFVDKIPRDNRIWIPNVFTPDRSDNNVFRIISLDIDLLEVSIYHRWGDWVCTFDGLSQGWDGTKNGHPCPEGTYVYRIRYHVVNSKETPHPILGTITLIR